MIVSAMYYAGGVTAWCLWRRRVRVTGARSLSSSGGSAALRSWWRHGSALWIVAEPWTAIQGGRRLPRVTFIDVGQGDSALVRFPHGATLLVDAWRTAGQRVLRHRRSRCCAGASRCRRSARGTLALTHGDADHVGARRPPSWNFGPGRSGRHSSRGRARSRRFTPPRTWWAASRAPFSVTIQRRSTRVGHRQHPPLPDWERQIRVTTTQSC
jgi:hypothetical protein